MKPELLAALISQIAVPEIVAWLKSKQASGDVIDDAAIIAKLGKDADAIIADGEAWLASHPA